MFYYSHQDFRYIVIENAPHNQFDLYLLNLLRFLKDLIILYFIAESIPMYQIAVTEESKHVVKIPIVDNNSVLNI